MGDQIGHSQSYRCIHLFRMSLQNKARGIRSIPLSCPAEPHANKKTTQIGSAGRCSSLSCFSLREQNERWQIRVCGCILMHMCARNISDRSQCDLSPSVPLIWSTSTFSMMLPTLWPGRKAHQSTLGPGRRHWPTF